MVAPNSHEWRKISIVVSAIFQLALLGVVLQLAQLDFTNRAAMLVRPCLLVVAEEPNGPTSR